MEKSNDRIFGNIRLAAITNALDLLTWGRPEEGVEGFEWGVVECPRIVPLLDQLANFDRDAKNKADDWVWSFLQGLWYIKRYYLVAQGGRVPVLFDVSGRTPARKKRILIDMRTGEGSDAVKPTGNAPRLG